MILDEEWTSLCSRINFRDDKDSIFNYLISKYTEPQRFYHNLDHIKNSLIEFQYIKDKLNNPLIVELAIWFHDIEYKPRGKENEKISANIAQNMLKKMDVESSIISNVSKFILSTIDHEGISDPDLDYFLDIDLAILGFSSSKFNKYENAIRKEFSWVPKFIFKKRRGSILKGFLSRKYIYSTAYFRDKYEKTARYNISNLLSADYK